MSSIRSYSRRAGSLFAVAALVLATITPGLVPSFASAAQLTERSIELSNSSKESTGVSYKVTFTPAADADLFVIDFCKNSPLLNVACDTPAGFTAAAGGATGGTLAVVDANTLKVTTTAALEAGTAKEVTITGITNPDDSGPIYARITTYTTANNTADPYVNATDLGTYEDDGAAAISITDTIGVSGAVLESMTFCIAGPTDNAGTLEPTTITNGCLNAASLPAPTLKLGKKTGDVIALDSSEVSTGSLYGQISTNASTGAIVNLKSNAFGCGGLLRAGDPSACDIGPAQTGGVAAQEAKFGARFNPFDDEALIGLSSYNATTYTMNYASNQQTGVTSTYGDPFFNTAGGPVSNQNLEVIFGASVAPNTPAGLYSAELSLIATGKF